MASIVQFSTKLDLVLRALSLSRGRLAAELGVDKSLVGRWASGTVTPSSHNLARLTALLGQRRAGFSILDWDRDAADLAALFGGDPQAIEASVVARAANARPPSFPQLQGLPAKPSVAVLPFANLSGDKDQTYFVDGVVEEIVATLERFKSFYVITVGGGDVGSREAARRLGVSYLLEGSVRRGAERVRITLHLVEAESGVEVWSDRLDDTLSDIFALQERVATRVAGVLEGKVLDAEGQRAAGRPAVNLSAYDFYLRSIPLFQKSRQAEMLEAIELLNQAMALDPHFPMARSQACVCLRQVIDHGWCDDPEALRRRGRELAEQALDAGGDDVRVMAQVAAALPGFDQRLDRSIALIARAIELNPSSAFVWLVSGSIRLKSGEPDLAAEHLETSIRLDPISKTSGFARMYLASARFQQRRFAESLALFDTTTHRLPVSYAVLAALHGHLGDAARARQALERLREVCPLPLETYAAIWFPRPADQSLLNEGLALAESHATASAR